MDAIRLPVDAVNARKDNYIWIFPTGPDSVAAVDPGEAEPVLRYLSEHSRRLSHVLITHHHADHIEGIDALRARHQPLVVGAAADQSRLPPLDLPVADQATPLLGEREVRVLATPGHTSAHLAYQVADALFVGDTLFRYGCGRLFEGTPEQMWRSLLKIRALPETTRLFPAHEYTRLNLRFVQSLLPDDQELQQQMTTVCQMMDSGTRTLPVELRWEKRFNPFLLCDDSNFVKRIGAAAQSPEVLFATLRERRNHF
ncbi:MAG: hydroxyacylglutathione hydrolase [Magnetococcales bacterium]|nr:hydroxyacylglutathione hydrolase [Magnetococcales bacterium]